MSKEAESKSKSKEKSKELKPQTSVNEEKIARKLVQNSTQALIQWMPLGGSGSVFISSLLNSQWIQAVLMFPVMAVTIVWAAYTESFLTRLRELAKEQGRKDVDFLKEVIEKKIRWQLAKAEAKYLRCQGNECREYRTEGFNRGTFVPFLSEVFVPLELSGVIGEKLPIAPGFSKDNLNINASRDDLRIWNLLAKVKQYPVYGRMAILAWGGYGKTTLLRHITYAYANNCHRRYKVPLFLPALLYLRKWQDTIATEENLDLPLLIEKHHIPSLPEGSDLKLPPNWVKEQLYKGRMLVMFDGFDEVKPDFRQSVSEWLDNQMRKYQKSIFILTSRPGGYKNYITNNSISSKLYVKPFNINQRERFIRQWYSTQERYARAGRNTPEVKQIVNEATINLLQQLEGRAELNSLAKNPLLLNMIANLHRTYFGQQLPPRRSELYRDICSLQLQDRPRYRGIDMLVPFSESQQILQKIALNLVKQNQTSIKRKKLEEEIKKHLEELNYNEVRSDNFLNQIVDISELIIKHDEDYEFAHLSFQAYLAAVEIKEEKQENLLIDNWEKSWWRETILLYGAQVNPSNLIRKLLQENNQEAAILAKEIIKESPRKIDREIQADLDNLEQSVSNLLYQKLENHLKNGEWQEADRETYRLMTQTMGKEEDQLLDREEIENFPCEDLRTIDQLWRKYSRDRFGYSIQKDIYQELGGTKELNYKILGNFAECVGWKKGGSWLEYNEIFRGNIEDKPVGNLPSVLIPKESLNLPSVQIPKEELKFKEELMELEELMEHWRSERFFSFLAQRIVTCKI